MILNNNKPIRQENKHTYIITIKKSNTRELKIGTTIKEIILKDLTFPINNKIRKSGNSKVVTIPNYLIKNDLLKIGTIIDKITY